MPPFIPQNIKRYILLCFINTTLLFLFNCKKVAKLKCNAIAVKLDQEHRVNSKAVNSSTQSINRYSSNLRKLTDASLNYDSEKSSLALSIENKDNDFIKINNIDVGFLMPLLPYKKVNDSKFDIANLILAEYSRNGISIPIQKSNQQFATINNSESLFNSKGEYIFKNGKYQPNPGVLPKRISVVNNCLSPGLWEINASDAVGEMYHSWLQLDKKFYNEILSKQTRITIDSIPEKFDDPIHFKNVALELDKLRTINSKIGEYEVTYHKEKEIGSYSSQDSRRKIQRKFYDIKRKDSLLQVSYQSELLDGDYFSMFTFEPPGIYNPKKRNIVKFERTWTNAKVNSVKPLTYYENDQEFLPSAYIEVEISDKNKSQGLIIGNIPLALLSFKNDFVIPSFGAGVLSSSELIERRLLRKKTGPKPSFAYLTKIKNGQHFVQNNHIIGLEQIFLRPIQKEDGIYLRFTIVSYERITDLFEFEIKIPELQEAFVENNASYTPPIFETYQDDNTL